MGLLCRAVRVGTHCSIPWDVEYLEVHLCGTGESWKGRELSATSDGRVLSYPSVHDILVVEREVAAAGRLILLSSLCVLSAALSASRWASTSTCSWPLGCLA